MPDGNMSFRELVPGAIYDEDVETLRSVLASGVDLNQPIDGVTALCLAARLGRLSIVKYLTKSAQVNIGHLSVNCRQPFSQGVIPDEEKVLHSDLTRFQAPVICN